MTHLFLLHPYIKNYEKYLPPFPSTLYIRLKLSVTGLLYQWFCGKKVKSWFLWRKFKLHTTYLSDRNMSTCLRRGPISPILESEILPLFEKRIKYPIFRFSLILIEKRWNFYMTITTMRSHITLLHKSALFKNKNLLTYTISYCKKNYKNFKKQFS